MYQAATSFLFEAAGTDTSAVLQLYEDLDTFFPAAPSHRPILRSRVVGRLRQNKTKLKRAYKAHLSIKTENSEIRR